MCVEGSLQTSSQAEPPSLCLWKSSQEPQEANPPLTCIFQKSKRGSGWAELMPGSQGGSRGARHRPRCATPRLLL